MNKLRVGPQHTFSEYVTKPLCVTDSGQLEKQLEDVSLARRDLEDSSRHIKTLEKQMKSVTQERDELHKVCETPVTEPRLQTQPWEVVSSSCIPMFLLRMFWRPVRS